MAKKLAFDRVLFTSMVLLLVLGLVMVYSASAVNPDPEAVSWNLFLKQVAAGALGLVALAAAMWIDYSWLSRPWIVYAGLLGTVALLIATLYGPEHQSTHRWLWIGGVSLQSSEIAKLALVVYLAYQIDKKADRVNSAALLVPCGFVTALLVVPILMQPDFGTAGLLLLISGLMLFLAGLAWRWVFLAVASLLPFLWILVMSVPYRRERLLTFLTPGADRLDTGFQVDQSLIAVGSGGLFGVGLGQSVQKLHFLPEAESDFIFSILSEEMGMIGSLGVLLLFSLFLWRGVRAGVRAPETFGRFLAWGFSGLIVVQALVNIGVTLSLLPTTGAPLPLLSAGGSSLVTTLAACGLVLNVSQHG